MKDFIRDYEIQTFFCNQTFGFKINPDVYLCDKILENFTEMANNLSK